MERESDLIERCAKASQAAYAMLAVHPLRSDPEKLWATCGAEVQEANLVTARAVLDEAGLFDRSLTREALAPKEPRNPAQRLLDFELEIFDE